MKRGVVAAAFAVLSIFSGVASADPPACSTSALRSCADWTAYYETSSQCVTTKCQIDVGYWAITHALISHEERFRICFYGDGTQCKETQTQVINECGGC